MNLFDVTNALSSRIVGGSDYGWSCYGPNARYLDFESDYAHASVIFDSTNQSIYEATIDAKEDGDDSLPGPYRWLNPETKSAFFAESKSKGVNPNTAWDNSTWKDLEVAEDWLEKAKAIFENKPFDRRVVVPLDLDDDVILNLALEAHKRDITLNKMVEILLQKAIDAHENTLKGSKS